MLPALERVISFYLNNHEWMNQQPQLLFIIHNLEFTNFE
jgi:hypothetical protein